MNAFGAYGLYGAYGAIGADAGSINGALKANYTLTTALVGETREDVRQLQQLLASIQYLTVNDCDGKYGNKTAAAVKRFQSAVGLSADGKAGPQTLSAILTPASFHKARTAAPPAAPTNDKLSYAPTGALALPAASAGAPIAPAEQDWTSTLAWGAVGVGTILTIVAIVSATKRPKGSTRSTRSARGR